MIDTNAVLAFTFSIISNFTSVVYVPPEQVPKCKADLKFCSVGRSFFPLDVYLQSKQGSSFWIANGVVEQFHAPKTYFELQDPERISEFVGTATLSSNEVFALADTTIRRLIKTGDPLAGITPRITVAKPYKGQTVPFYDITWPLPENPQVFSIARVGVDARSGRIVLLSLRDTRFYDMALFQQISNRVYRPSMLEDAPPAMTNAPNGLPAPELNMRTNLGTPK